MRAEGNTWCSLSNGPMNNQNDGPIAPQNTHYIHSYKGNINETPWLYHWDLDDYNGLRLPTTAWYMTSTKYSQQQMNITVLSLRNSRSRTNHISSFGYVTLPPYIWLYYSKEMFRSNYSSIGGSPSHLVLAFLQVYSR